MNILDTIGHTPLIYLNSVSAELPAKIFVKYEARNPGGSIKDRAALGYVRAAIREGALAPGGTVVEATSGNLGIGLAVVCGKMNLRLILTMPASASKERIALLRAMGAEVVLTPAEEGMQGAQNKVEELLASIPGAYRPNQFSNPVGPRVHYSTTGVEILEDCRKEGFVPQAFVAGIGSGATLMGVSLRLKEANPSIRCFAVEPAESPVLSEGRSGPHGIQGIGAGFVPDILDTGIYDEIIPVKDEDAFTYGRIMGKKEGVLVGISSGAALAAAVELARREENAGKQIVVLMPDTGDRYLSTKLFAAGEN